MELATLIFLLRDEISAAIRSERKQHKLRSSTASRGVMLGDITCTLSSTWKEVSSMNVRQFLLQTVNLGGSHTICARDSFAWLARGISKTFLGHTSHIDGPTKRSRDDHNGDLMPFDVCRSHRDVCIDDLEVVGAHHRGRVSGTCFILTQPHSQSCLTSLVAGPNKC